MTNLLIEDMSPDVARFRAMAYGRLNWPEHLLDAFPAHLQEIAAEAYAKGKARAKRDERGWGFLADLLRFQSHGPKWRRV